MTNAGNDAHSEQDAEYEARLRRRLAILKEEFDAGRIALTEGLKVIDSLKAVRYSADGEVDLSTVDGLVRSMALGVEHISDRRKIKETVSLSEIQKLYFDFVEMNFKDIYAEMVRVGANPHAVARHISGDSSYRAPIAKGAAEFLAAIDQFWEDIGPVVHIHLEDMHGPLKCVFGGDLFPAHNENIASKCGIYTDTIILPDPFLRSRDMFKRWDEQQAVYYLVKHALNILQYKDLACADLDQPIVVIAPDYTALEQSEKQFIYDISQDDALHHAGQIFGRKFTSLEELVEYASKLDTVDSVVAKIKRPDRVLFDASWDLPLRESIVRALDEPIYKAMGIASPGLLVATQSMGRMGTSNELLIKAARFGGSPVIDAPTSWQYFAWKLEYDAERASAANAELVLHVLKGLGSLASGEMQWLGRVPSSALIEIRKVGALPELREMLSKGVEDLVQTNPANFYRTTDRVFDNIHAAFSQHQKNIDALKEKKWKFATKDIGTWLAVGSIEVAAALTGTPIWGMATIAANQLTDAPKLKELPASIKKLAEESKRLKRSPVGLLFQYSDKSD
jgi:hypothetical protein